MSSLREESRKTCEILVYALKKKENVSALLRDIALHMTDDSLSS